MGLTEKQRWVRAISAGYQHVDMKFCMDLGLGTDSNSTTTQRHQKMTT